MDRALDKSLTRLHRTARLVLAATTHRARVLFSRALLLLWVVLASSCGGYETLRRDLHTMQTYADVEGEVEAPTWSGGPLVVAAFRAPDSDDGRFSRVEVQELARPGEFRFRLPPGDYSFCVYEDRDGDHTHTPGEPFGVWRRFEPTTLAPSSRFPVRLVAASRGVSPPEQPARDGRVVQVGVRASLDEPRFDAFHGRLGVWEPLAFVAARAYGLFVLEGIADESLVRDTEAAATETVSNGLPTSTSEAASSTGTPATSSDPTSTANGSTVDTTSPERVPVVFVHGILGHASEFRDAVAALDRTRYVPWVFQYPSGLPLGEQAERFAAALREMRSRERAKRVCVVAHSMGGLVSRAMLARLATRDDDVPEVPLFVTLASPLAGHAGASAGVAMAPVIVPSWEDLEPGSPFLASLYETPLSERTRYALFFAFASTSAWSGAPGDGVVTLESQLRPEAQGEADWVRGFGAEHAGIVRDATALGALNELLATHCRAE
ncbi:MAG: alpha/beta fold hydrolase [Sandaracinus sp.]|nr:alpha/beta fold hydrolase [Sandaracinus sp.]